MEERKENLIVDLAFKFSLAILILWERPKLKQSNFFQVLHGTLVTIVVGVFINEFLQHFYPEFALKESHLVSIPVAENMNDLLQQMHSPDFSQLTNPAIYLSASMLAFLASLEKRQSLSSAIQNLFSPLSFRQAFWGLI